jgi:calcineurin-like phosphoesterase family protein
MNETIIQNWNATVGVEDEVWILGDVSFDKRGEQVRDHISRLKGKKFLVLGNHDHVIKKHALDLFEEVYDYRKLYYQDKNHPKGRWEFILCHYPIISWDMRHHGSIHCHGHCHGTLKLPAGMQTNMFDVGVDNVEWNFAPVSAEELISRWVNIKYMKSQDHHDVRDPR